MPVLKKSTSLFEAFRSLYLLALFSNQKHKQIVEIERLIIFQNKFYGVGRFIYVYIKNDITSEEREREKDI